MYSYNMTLWGFGEAIPSTYSNDSVFDSSSLPHTVALDGIIDDLNVTFVSTSGVVEDDTWTILLSACGASSPLPSGASAALISVDGTAAVAQLTLDRGFEGTVRGSHEVYLVNQHFTVRAAGTEMQSVTVANEDSTTWTNGNPSYSLTFNGSSPTACLAYDAEDWEMEVCKQLPLRFPLKNSLAQRYCLPKYMLPPNRSSLFAKTDVRMKYPRLVCGLATTA